MRKKRITVTMLAAYAFLIVLAIVYLLPITWALLSTFKFNKDVVVNGFSFFPERWTLES